MCSFRELKRTKYSGILLAVGVAALTAQESEPAFDTVSVKLLDRRQPAPSRIEPKRVTLPYVTLGDLIDRAYSSENYQVIGPDWLAVNRYEVIANIPDGATAAQVPAMLRRLLRERFALQVHTESKNRSVYVLLTGSHGPKLKPADPPASVTPGAPPSPAFWISSTGHLRLRAATMDRFAAMLSNSLGEPVLNETGLQGVYDLEVNVSPSALQSLRLTTDTGSAPAPEESPAPGIHSDLRALGLRLATRKADVQYLIVDSVRKVPTPN